MAQIDVENCLHDIYTGQGMTLLRVDDIQFPVLITDMEKSFSIGNPFETIYVGAKVIMNEIIDADYPILLSKLRSALHRSDTYYVSSRIIPLELIDVPAQCYIEMIDVSLAQPIYGSRHISQDIFLRLKITNDFLRENNSINQREAPKTEIFVISLFDIIDLE